MTRKIFFITSVILLAIASFIASMFIHELGHVLMAIFFLQVQPSEFHIGIESYVKISVLGASNFDLGMISIGSIILPELIYLLLLLFKNVYADIVRIISGCSLYVHIILSIVVLIFGSKAPETYDLLQFRHYLNLDSKIIILGLVLLLLLNIILEVKNKGAKRIIDKIENSLF